jgi:hypothetical protein
MIGGCINNGLALVIAEATWGEAGWVSADAWSAQFSMVKIQPDFCRSELPCSYDNRAHCG